MFRSRLLLLSLTLIAAFLCLAATAAQLPKAELEALRGVAKALGKKGWEFSVDPCRQKPVSNDSDNAVLCNCAFVNATVCHVTGIILKSQNLTGTLPDISKLPYLQQIDLHRNYLNGTLPPEWGSSKLVFIAVLGNRLSGSIPKEFGNISTLETLIIEANQISGKLPPELGNLPNLKKLQITSNNLSGEFPDTLAKLTTLEEFLFGDNRFTGAIPNFIGNWTNLKKLFIQASGFSGPIPSGIAKLENLTDLRITDLSGPDARFPPLQNMTKIVTLFLRNCNISGSITNILNDFPQLRDIDLSFNKLSGEIKGPLNRNFKHIYLTGNMLSGSVPSLLLNQKGQIDLSYNNFTPEASAADNCVHPNVNLFASYSRANKYRIDSCSGISKCRQTWYSLHINCGGEEVYINNTKYEKDTYKASTDPLYTKSNWGISITGFFTDISSNKDPSLYIAANTSRVLTHNSKLYINARLSPISVTYYAFCLANGSYTVKLHFAEIMFTNDDTSNSLGRRLFNVYIQEKLVLKDFNIAEEAGGVSKELLKSFNVSVSSNGSLEIRLYWAGKGTTAIPDRGVYGPLVSAISIDPNFVPPQPLVTSTGSGISVGGLVGIAVGGVLLVVFVVTILWLIFCFRKKSALEKDLKGLDLKTGKFTLREIKAATNNFDEANKIGEGGFGSVYKGVLSDDSVIAVKQLSSKSQQGNREFLNEIGMISALQHPHLVKLYGCCVEGDQLLLVYEYLQNNNVGRALFGPPENHIKLDWPTRSKICIGIARGLAFLHEESRLKVVHRDIKATNILLDENLSPKISDFGLAKLDAEEKTHISTRIAGTYGYMAPEYAMRGHLTDKADVYSYGIVILEIISGRRNTTPQAKGKNFYLLDWAHELREIGGLMELVDPRVGTDYDREAVSLTINVSLLCSSVSPAVRPKMSAVVRALEGKTPLREEDMSSKDEIAAMRQHFQAMREGNNPEIRTKSVSVEGPWTGSSSSVPDLYPINPDSDYSQQRSN